VKKIFILLLSFSFIIFLASFSSQNKAFATINDCTPVTKETYSNGDCLGAWNNLVGKKVGTPLTEDDINKIIQILSDNDMFNSHTWFIGFYIEDQAKEDFKNVMMAHINEPWNTELLIKLQGGIQDAANSQFPWSGDNGAGGAVCNSGDQCLSGTCTLGRCVPGTAEIVCENVGTNTNPKFKCSTAIGPINTDVTGFSKSILQILLGLSGGILLVMIIINGYKIMTSQGDPEKIKDAREGIIAAIAGILLIIFSVSILQLITVDIIGIPGFRR
jgi:hypothetical protein